MQALAFDRVNIMNGKDLYKQTFDFERQTLQLGNPQDGFSDLDIQELEDKLKSVSREIRKKYLRG